MSMSGRACPGCVMLTSETTVGLLACNLCYMLYNKRFTRSLMFNWKKRPKNISEHPTWGRDT